jgi:hypothetical protein
MQLLCCIYGFIGCCATWILLMPIFPAVAKTSMERFHLMTGSFGVWAILQPIPSMYNFANDFEIRQLRPGEMNTLLSDPLLASPLDEAHDFGKIHEEYINHFPARVFTFSSHRQPSCERREDLWLVTRSNYRGQQVETLTELDFEPPNSYKLTRQRMPGLSKIWY